MPDDLTDRQLDAVRAARDDLTAAAAVELTAAVVALADQLEAVGAGLDAVDLDRGELRRQLDAAGAQLVALADTVGFLATAWAEAATVGGA